MKILFLAIALVTVNCGINTVRKDNRSQTRIPRLVEKNTSSTFGLTAGQSGYALTQQRLIEVDLAVYDNTDVDTNNAPATYCLGPLPSTFELGEIVCDADKNFRKPITAKNVQQKCKDGIDAFGLIPMQEAVEVGGCAKASVHMHKFDPPIVAKMIND